MEAENVLVRRIGELDAGEIKNKASKEPLNTDFRVSYNRHSH